MLVLASATAVSVKIDMEFRVRFFQQIDISEVKYMYIWQITSQSILLVLAGAGRSGGGAPPYLWATKGRLSCIIYMITEQKTIILDGELKIDQSEASDLQRRAEG